MRNLLTLVAFVAFLFGPATATHAQISAGIRMGQPPPPRASRVPPQPGPGYEWVEGYWYPQGSRYVWHEGYWTRAPYEGAYWVAPYYGQGQYFAGHWEGRQGRIEHDHQWDRGQQRDAQRYDTRAPNAAYQRGDPSDRRAGQPNSDQGGGPFNGRSNTARAPQAGGAFSSTIAIPGNQAWTPTNISVTQGEVLKFQSTGTVQFSPDRNDKAGPGGAPNRHTVAGAPLPAAPAGSLLLRIDNGQPLSLSSQTAAQMPASGMLFLGINDDNVSDNTGQFTVTISR